MTLIDVNKFLDAASLRVCVCVCVRGRAPCVSDGERVALQPALHGSLGDGARLPLAPRESRGDGGRGPRVSGRQLSVPEHGAVWPLHLHGEQQAGPQLGYLHGRYESETGRRENTHKQQKYGYTREIECTRLSGKRSNLENHFFERHL